MPAADDGVALHDDSSNGWIRARTAGAFRSLGERLCHKPADHLSELLEQRLHKHLGIEWQ
jgi:hypothetical protein